MKRDTSVSNMDERNVHDEAVLPQAKKVKSRKNKPVFKELCWIWGWNPKTIQVRNIIE